MTALELRTNLENLNIRNYRKFSPDIYSCLLQVSKKLRRRDIIHINATAVGGGVAEILKSQVPLENSLGLKSCWLTIKAPRRFFNITKKIHNLLQGKNDVLAEEEMNFYREINKSLGKSFQNFCRQFSKAVVLVHDPQPLPIIDFIPKDFLAILRLHIDLLTPNAVMREALRPFIAKYAAVILSSPHYRISFPWLQKSKIKIVPPAIDPLSEKNRLMELDTAKIVLEQFGINTSRPIITQVSRFDPWKDPLGIIKAYYIAKNQIPDLQLVLAGFFLAKDDPEAISVFEQVKKHDRGDPDIFLFSDTRKLKDISNDSFVNALYTASDVIIQKSIREGFGLTMTEAMWKAKAVVAGKTSGALLQIKSGKNGILVSSPEEAGRAVVRLLKNKKLRDKLGKAARKSVKQKFLIPRFLLDNLKIYLQIVHKK